MTMDTQSLFSQILKEEDMRELVDDEKKTVSARQPFQDSAPQSRFERFFIIKDILEDVARKLQKARDIFSQEMERMALPKFEQHQKDHPIEQGILKEDSSEIQKPLVLFIEQEESLSGQKIIEGVFDGQNMIGLDGKQYHVPVNYASKSKLVEGDTLKLTISGQGNFLYKQIGPIERIRIVATLDYHSDMREYSAKSQDKVWKVLTASITYFKGLPGDEVVLIVPKSRMSTWAAVENIIKKDLI